MLTFLICIYHNFLSLQMQCVFGDASWLFSYVFFKFLFFKIFLCVKKFFKLFVKVLLQKFFFHKFFFFESFFFFCFFVKVFFSQVFFLLFFWQKFLKVLFEKFIFNFTYFVTAAKCNGNMPSFVGIYIWCLKSNFTWYKIHGK